jgi:hypothetical protein
MKTSARIERLSVVTSLVSLLVGAGALVWAVFGMPGWFFIASQVWLWTLGLPTVLGVLLVTFVWGIPGWTTFPLWLYVPSAALVAVVFQHAACLGISRLWRRLAGKRL